MHTIPGELLKPADVAITAGYLLSDAAARVTGTCIDMHPELIPGCLPRKFGSPEGQAPSAGT